MQNIVILAGNIGQKPEARTTQSGTNITEEAEEIVTEAIRDLARWAYRQLQTEYDHLTADETVEDGIIANVYTFTEAGQRLG